MSLNRRQFPSHKDCIKLISENHFIMLSSAALLFLPLAILNVGSEASEIRSRSFPPPGDFKSVPKCMFTLEKDAPTISGFCPDRHHRMIETNLHLYNCLAANDDGQLRPRPG